MGNMRYPINIQSELKRENSTKSDKKQALVYVCLLGFGGMVVLFYMLIRRFFNVPMYVPVLVSLALSTLIFLFVFKNFIFKEDEKIKKLQKQNSESLLRFYSLSKDEVDRVKLNNKMEIPIYEYRDGNTAFVMEFKFGSNMASHTINNTYTCLTTVFNLILQAGFNMKIIISPEDFRTSDEYSNYINKLNNSPADKVYVHTMLRLIKHMTQHNVDSTGITTIAVIVKSRMTYQRYGMAALMSSILDAVYENRTGFRHFSYLDGKRFKDFLTRFYGLGALDLSKYDASDIDLNLREKYARIVKLYSKTDEYNNTTRYDVFGNTFNNTAREVR